MTQEVKPQDHPDFIGGWIWTELEIRWIKERIAKAVLDEREACAKIVEDSPSYDWHKFACEAAYAIRQRGQA